MASAAEIKSSIYGAWRIARLDPQALGYFNVSADGFWRSFIAVPITLAIILPELLFGGDAIRGDAEETLSRGAEAVVVIIGVLVSWILFPIAMIWISRLLDRGATYAQFIIIWNWSSVVSAAVVLPAAILYSHRFPNVGVTDAIMTVVFFALLFYAFRVALVGLACNALTAIGITVFEFVLHRLVDAAVRSFT